MKNKYSIKKKKNYFSNIKLFIMVYKYNIDIIMSKWKND